MLTTANQDTPLAGNLAPVLVIDVWEHAYYLKHFNVRADYIKDWFEVVNWRFSEEQYKKNSPTGQGTLVLTRTEENIFIFQISGKIHKRGIGKTGH